MSDRVDTIHVLHVDDEPDFAELVETYIQREDPRITVSTAMNAADGRQVIEDTPVDCVVSDYDMPGMNGIEFLEHVREDHPDLPFILFTGKGSEEVASDAISTGVTDYLQKETGTDQYALLANRITNAVERHRIEREADQTQSQLQAITDNSADAILTIDADSRIRFANTAVEDHFGYDPADLVGESLLTLIPERFHDDHLHGINRYLETGERTIDWSSVEFLGRHADGHEIPLALSFSTFRHDGDTRFIGILRDISERAEMEAALRERDARFRQLADNLRDVIWMSDTEKDELLFVNQAYEDVWGRTIEELESNPMSFLDTIHPDDREQVEAALDAQTSGGYDEEYRVVQPDGEVRWVHDRAFPIENDDGEVYRIVGIASDVTERKRRIRRIETLVSNLPGVVYRCVNEPPWPMEYVWGECEALTGYTTDALESGDVLWGRDVIHPADQEWVWEAVQDAVDANTNFQVQYRIQTKNGETKWLWERGRAVNDTTAPSEFLEGFITDITAQKEHERALETSNTLLSTLIDELPVGILAEDADRNVMTVNQRLLDVFQVDTSPGALVGQDCEAVARQAADQTADPAEFVDRINELVAAREPVFTDTIEFAGGRTFERSYQPLELPAGDGHLWTYRDVTGRRERETQLEALSRTAQSLLDADSRSAVAAIGVEAAADILGLQANAIHLYNAEQNALVPVAASDDVHALVDTLPTFGPGDSIAWRVFEAGEPAAIDDNSADPDVYNPETQIRSELILPIGDRGVLLAGSETPAAFDEQDLVLGDILAGNIAAALGQVDRTLELRERERELERQNDRLEEFTSVVSHDLRNPLNVARGHLELVQDDVDHDSLDAVSRAHERMATLIDDLLSLARDGESETETEVVDLGSVSTACWENVDTRTATLDTDVDRRIRADPGRLRQLFENLYRNAVEHGSTSSRSHTHENTVEHGSTNNQDASHLDDAVEHGSTNARSHTHENNMEHDTTNNRDASRLDDADEHGGESVTITVGEFENGFFIEDDGPGISEDERERVLESGYSTTDRGTGFGLSIVQQIVDAHGWTLTITESPTGGARFEIGGVEFVPDGLPSQDHSTD